MKPDFEKMAREYYGDVTGALLSAHAFALRAAYAAGLNEAVDIIAETCRVRLLNINDANAYIANIERMKEADHG